VIPPLQCPLGLPNWSGLHQELGEGTGPSVTQTVGPESSEEEEEESLRPADALEGAAAFWFIILAPWCSHFLLIDINCLFLSVLLIINIEPVSSSIVEALNTV